MRIIGYISHPTYLITVFKMDDKFSVQFEKGLLVQTYKYRSGPNLNNMADVEGMVTATFWERVDQLFDEMELTRKRFLPVVDEGEFFEDII